MYSNLAEVIIKLEALVMEQQQHINQLELEALVARTEAEAFREAAQYYKKIADTKNPQSPKDKWDDFFKPSEN
jgi:methyltransferase-like protein